MVEVCMDAHAEDVVDLLIKDAFREPEARDLGPHHAAALVPFVVQVDLISQGCKVAGDREGRRTATDEAYFLAVLFYGRQGNPVLDVALIVGRDPLQSAYRHRFFVDPAAPARRLAWTVAGAAEHTGENIGFPVDHIGIVIPFRGDKADVFRYGGVRRTCVLAIDHLVE